MSNKRDTSRDGFKNKLETFALTGLKPIWNFIQSNDALKKTVNKSLVNIEIAKLPTRPYPFSTMSPYTSWESLTERTYSGLHLPPLDWKPSADKNYTGFNLAPAEKFEKNLPPIEKWRCCIRKPERLNTRLNPH